MIKEGEVKKGMINEQGEKKEETRKRRVGKNKIIRQRRGKERDGGESEMKMFLFIVYLTTMFVAEAI
jgi:hypothetical protein